MSAEEIIHGLSGANAKLDQARQQAQAAAQTVGEAHTMVAGALRGSSAAGLLAQIAQIREALNKAAQGIEPAKISVNQTINQTKALGN